jgi:hypothetical protein
MEEIQPKKSVWANLKAISPATYIGLALVALFLYFCNIDTCAVRWRLMLPLAAAGIGLFQWRRKRAPAVEARICTAGLCLLVALFLLRDIGLSNQLAGLLDQMNQYKSQVNELSGALDRFFGGGR